MRSTLRLRSSVRTCETVASHLLLAVLVAEVWIVAFESALRIIIDLEALLLSANVFSGDRLLPRR